MALKLKLLVIFAIVFFAGLACKKDKAVEVIKIDNVNIVPGALAQLEYIYPDFKTSDTFMVKRKAYHLNYNEQYEQANWACYVLTRKMVQEGKLPRIDNFKSDPSIPDGSASVIDYYGSSFDKGHLVPVADMNWDAEAMDETFYMSNISPMLPDFNRIVWKNLEDKVRKWAILHDSLLVITGPVLQHVVKSIGNDIVGVPSAFFKVIVDISGSEYHAVAFKIPHMMGMSPDVYSYALSIDELEIDMSCDFFYKVKKSKMDAIEKDLNKDFWP